MTTGIMIKCQQPIWSNLVYTAVVVSAEPLKANLRPESLVQGPQHTAMEFLPMDAHTMDLVFSLGGPPRSRQCGFPLLLLLLIKRGLTSTPGPRSSLSQVLAS